MQPRRHEATRDQTESAFTPILRRLYGSVSALLAAVFVDQEGESIDYVSVLEPFEAKVNAAHMHMLLGLTRRLRAASVVGESFGLEICAEQREVWVRRLGEEYLLVMLLEPGFDRAILSDALTLTCQEFRSEVGLEAPTWELLPRRLSVRVRASPGWPYAPEDFSADGIRVQISAVLGRWTEDVAELPEPLVCFRVRTEHGEELTLEHDRDRGDWRVRERE